MGKQVEHRHGMSQTHLSVGDTVLDSPMGVGRITDFTDVGYPRVDGVAVVWLRRTDGVVYDPIGKAPKDLPPVLPEKLYLEPQQLELI
jgi:hypothetical protein